MHDRRAPSRRRLVARAILAISLATLFAAPLAAEKPAPGSATEAEIERLERAWNEAHLRGDAAQLDALWADDVVFVVPGMPPMRKPETLRMWRSGRVKFTRYNTSQTTVFDHGETVVVTGRLERFRDFSGREAQDDWQFTKVYVRRGGRWRVVAFHASETPR